MGQNDWTESIYNERVEFTAETPPGTKVCFAVRYDNYTNDLKTRGREAGEQWLESCFDAVGARSSVDVRERFL